MRILVYGAGVIGSLVAARLHDAGHDVTILARGERLASIRRRGIVIRDERTDRVTTSLVPAIEALAPDDAYDLVMVVVRREQLEGVLPALEASTATPDVVVMCNGASEGDAVRTRLGDRAFFGFPGAGGTIVDGVVQARLTSGRLQRTMLGEADGRRSERLLALARALEEAGFPVAISPRIEAWMRTHLAVVGPAAYAIYASAGSTRRLARTPDALLLGIRAIREGFAVLRSTGVPITPRQFGWAFALPEPLLAAVLARALDTEAAELVLARHATAARAEMAELHREFGELVRASGRATPALDRLATYLDPSILPLPEGSRTLRRRRWPRIAAILTAGAAFAVVLRSRRPHRDAG